MHCAGKSKGLKETHIPGFVININILNAQTTELEHTLLIPTPSKNGGIGLIPIQIPELVQP